MHDHLQQKDCVTPIFFDGPSPDELHAKPGAYYGGAQHLRGAFVRTLLKSGMSQRVVFAVRNGMRDPLRDALRAIDVAGACEVLTFSELLERPHTLQRAVVQCLGGGLARAAHLSLSGSCGRWPVVSMTHDLFEPRVAEDLVILDRLNSWPVLAVACASRAARAAVGRMVDELIQQRRGTKRAIALPIIAHGIDLEGIPDCNLSDTEKYSCRKSVGLDCSDFVALYVGRLSLAAKADLLLLITAFTNMRHGGAKALILAGSSGDRCELAALHAAAGNVTQSSANSCVIIVENPSELQKWRLLRSADVFVSPANSLQESFGLALVEAMAAGLPVVATNWSGYADLVVPDVTGLLVETSVTESDLNVLTPLIFLEDAGWLHGRASRAVRINGQELSAALERLANDPGLRRELAREAIKNAKNFDIRRMISRYERLWQLLSNLERNPVTSDRSSIQYDVASVFGGFWKAS